MARDRIVIIGAGNVATHLARALDVKADVVQVVSRHIASARCLAERLRCATAVTDMSDVVTDADLYLISVSDDSIRSVAETLPCVNGIVAHTSGSVGIEALYTARQRGVVYPLQTFSKHTEVDVAEVPFFIEGSDDETTSRLTGLASLISRRVYRADSARRAALHVSAVFGCNFFNHLLHISSEILKANGYTLDVLGPLLRETLAKAMAHDPLEVQTGPAVRGDRTVTDKHMAMLDGTPRDIYSLMTQAIAEAHGVNADNP